MGKAQVKIEEDEALKKAMVWCLDELKQIAGDRQADPTARIAAIKMLLTFLTEAA